MAICSPYGKPRFIQRTEENDRGGLLGQILNRANEIDDNIKPREGFDAAWQRTYRTYLNNVLPMSWDELNAYFVQQGWLTKKGKLGKIRAEDEGMAAAVTKTYLESVGGGIRQAADNFLMKVNAGEDATSEGLFLAQQMQHASKFSGYVLGWDQSYGRAVRAQGLRNMAPEVGEAVRRSGATPGSAEAFGDAFTDIARKMQGEDMRGAIDDLVMLAKRVQFADTPLQAMRISGTAEMAGNAWREVWVNGLLSSPATAITNLTAVTWAAARPMAQYMTASMYEMAGLPGKMAAQQAAAEAGETLSAMYQGLMDGAKLGWQAFKSERSIYAPLTGTTELAANRAISGANFQEQMAKRGFADQGDQYAEMFDTLGRVTRMPSRILLGSDEFVKHLVVRGEVAAQGVKRAAEAGVDLTDKAALKKFMDAEYEKAFRLDMPDPKDKWAVQNQYEYAYKIRDEANTATFQENNGFAQWVSNGTSRFPMLQPFIPFVRTPLNILKQGFVESTGLGAAIKAGKITMAEPTMAHIRIMEELMKDPGESFRVAGQIAMTGSLGAMVYAGVMNGQITGGGPGRWAKGGKASDQQKTWLKAMNEEGRVPYSVMTPFGAVPFDRFGEPVAITLRMIADVAQYSGYMTRDEQDASMFAITGIMVSGLYQASFLQGIDNLMGAAFGDNEQGSLKSKAVQNYVATQTPFGGLLNYIDKVTDPYAKAYKGASFEEVMAVHENGLGLIFAKVADRMPGMSGQPVQVDQIVGAPIPSYYGGGPAGLNPLQLAVPFAPRGIPSADRTWSKVQEIMGSYTEARPTGGLKVTDAEQQALNARMATTRIGGLTFSQWIDGFYRRGDVQRFIKNKNGTMTEMRTGIENEFNRMKNQYMNQALEEYSAVNRNVYQRRVLLESTKLKRRNNDLSFENDLAQIDELLKEARRQGVF